MVAAGSQAYAQFSSQLNAILGFCFSTNPRFGGYFPSQAPQKNIVKNTPICRSVLLTDQRVNSMVVGPNYRPW